MISKICFIGFILISYAVALGVGYHLGFIEGKEATHDLISHFEENHVFDIYVEDRYIEEDIIDE